MGWVGKVSDRCCLSMDLKNERRELEMCRRSIPGRGKTGILWAWHVQGAVRVGEPGTQ